jgi:hypothetical protein
MVSLLARLVKLKECFMPARATTVALLLATVYAIGADALGAQERVEYFYVRNDCTEPIKFYIRSLASRRPSPWVGPAVIAPGEGLGYVLQEIGLEPFEIMVYQDGTIFRFEREYLCSMMRECQQTGRTDWNRPAIMGRTIRRGNRIFFQELPRPNILRFPALVDENTVTFMFGARQCAYMQQLKEVDDDNPPPPPPPRR